jgi:predicted RNase H-like nuclease (RuvC/YqgF family)
MLDRINRWRAWLAPRRTAARLLSESQQRAIEAERKLLASATENAQLQEAIERRDADLTAACDRFRESLKEVDELKARLLKSQRKVRQLRQQEREAVGSIAEAVALREDLVQITHERDQLVARLEIAELKREDLEGWQAKVMARMDAETAIEVRRKQNALHVERTNEHEH